MIIEITEISVDGKPVCVGSLVEIEIRGETIFDHVTEIEMSWDEANNSDLCLTLASGESFGLYCGDIDSINVLL